MLFVGLRTLLRGVLICMASCTATARVADTSSGGGTSTTNTSGNVTTSEGSSPVTSGGSLCVPTDCVDNNPCTVDACGGSGCTHTPRSAGEAGDLSEGPCAGLCQTDGMCGLSLYKRNLDEMVWTRTAISLEWKGENAPPPRGIVSATMGSSFDYLVLTEDGRVYRRFSGAWAAPREGSELFGVKTGLAHAFLYRSEFNDYVMWAPIDGIENSIRYSISGTTVAQFDANPTVDTPKIPAATHPMQWAVQLPDETILLRLADGDVYDDLSGDVSDPIPEAEHFVWGDPGTAPTPGTVIEAMIVSAAGKPQIQFLAP